LQAIGQAAIQQGYRVLYRETHQLLDELAEATIDGTRKELMELFASVPLLIIDDLGMRKLPVTAAEDLLELIMRRYEQASTLLTSNRPVEDWGKLLGGQRRRHCHARSTAPSRSRAQMRSAELAYKNKLAI
jgi:DNA replication protein DnaC